MRRASLRPLLNKTAVENVRALNALLRKCSASSELKYDYIPGIAKCNLYLNPREREREASFLSFYTAKIALKRVTLHR